MSAQAKVVFTPAGRRGTVSVGSTVLDAARSLGVDLDSVCGGRGICGRCQIEVSDGMFRGVSSDPDHLSPPARTETDYRGRRELVTGRRLGCSAQILGDVVIHVPPDSQVHRQVVRKRAEVVDIDVDPIVRLYYVEVSQPALGEPAGDLRRLLEALESEWGVGDLSVDLGVVQGVQDALRQGKWTVTVAVHDDEVLTAVWPGFRDTVYGVAFDVGSTTLAGHLCDLLTGEVVASAGAMNPQIRFGEDLMSRVSYIMMNPGGDAALTTAVQEFLARLLSELVARAGVPPSDVLDITLVGNPIMHHLALGIDPSELGTAPFTLGTDEAVRTTADSLDLGAHPGARVYALPCIAGHVGADAAGAILSEGPHRRDEIQLLVDVGTNAEIMLGNRHRLLAASSPTGPAFEGAQISSGQRAAPGAIERVRIDRQTFDPRLRVIGSELWSDDPGFEESVATSGITGICGSGIIEAIAELYLAGAITADGVIAPAKSSPRFVREGRTYAYLLYQGEPPILITQSDVRAIQLAKAALRAGARLLMDHLGVDRVDSIRLAGAFGSQIDPKYAMVLGLIPDCDLKQVSAAGNAAGTGAVMALLSSSARKEIEAVVRSVEKIETAIEPRFQEHFVEAMAIPHRTAPYPNLAQVVDLPVSGEHGSAQLQRRRRRAERKEGP